MRISVIGSGYVGTTVAACLADAGHEVVNIDIDEDIVASINEGVAPIHEEGLDELVAEYGGNRLRATKEYDAVTDTEITFLCLPTPSREDGSVDLTAFEAGVSSLGDALAEKDEHIVVVKSTVPPGTAESVVAPAFGSHVHVVSNPEFLREGTAVSDLRSPDKVVVGSESAEARAKVLKAYEGVHQNEPAVVEMTNSEAELVKYANNAFLAAKVSLVNELGNISKELGVDAYEVLDAVGLDDRVSSRFLRSGLGWGGSCFPKDVDAIRAVARDEGYDSPLLNAAIEVNDLQPKRAVELLERHINPKGSRIAVLGLAFKPGTDDVRNSRAIDLAELLVERGAEVVAYDPEASENARTVLPESVEIVSSAEDALEGADAVVVATAWEEFDGVSLDGMNEKVVIDGRRVDLQDEADVYEGLCW
ncbi:MAG: UDP-glucose/GDP-mannose dehydrogenase family protein [Halobacteriales archaeon]|nr:UDP-glucose/GDP-mannose dehydrogenase family protein [Halobacteriales archaeon]